MSRPWEFVLMAILLAGGPEIFGGQKLVEPVSIPEVRILSLEESVNLALVHNLNLQSSMDMVVSSYISQGVAESRFNLKLTPSFSRGFGSDVSAAQRYGLEASKLLPFGATVSTSLRSDITGSDIGNFTSSVMDFTVSQPLLRGFGPRATQFNLVNSRRNVQSSERHLEISRQRLTVDVVAGYYNIVRQQGLVEVSQKSLERSKELLRASEARLEVGLASKLDVFRAELQLSQAEEGFIMRQEALELAFDNFKFKLGLGPGEEITLEMLEPEYLPFSVDVDSLTQQALVNRVEMLEERDRIQDSKRSVAISRQNLLPQLNLNLRYQENGLGASFAESFRSRDRGINVFLSSSYQLDRTADSASYAMSQIDLEARRRSLRLVEYNIANQVRAGARNVIRIGKSIELQERNIDFAEKQLRLANLRYQRGLASNFDIIDAENNVIQARSNYVSLLADFHVSLIELKRVTGTLEIEKEFAPGSFLSAARHHP